MAIHRRAVGFGEPDRGSEVIDVGVRQQDRGEILGSETQAAQRCQNIVTMAREAGVDEHDARVVGDHCPVHQGCLGEVDVIGDGGQHRGHVEEFRQPALSVRVALR